MQQERFQLGEFWLDQRTDSPVWCICWVEKQGRRYRTRRLTTGERTYERAQERLAEHFLQNVKLHEEKPEDVPIAFVLDRYYEKHASKLPSKDSAKSAIANWKLFWKDDKLSQLVLDRQDAFKTWLAGRTYKRGKKICPLSRGTIVRQFNVGPTAFEWARKQQEIKYYPAIDFMTDGTRRKRVLTIVEAAALFNAAAGVDHHWRWLLLSFATVSRPNAPLDIMPWAPMVDLENQRIDLLPPGHIQDPKKRRPIIPIAATLLPWLRIWTNPESLVHRGKKGKVVDITRLITWRGKRIKKITSAFDKLKERAGITDPRVVPYTIRHTMTTWFMKQRVPEWDREVYLGHKSPGNQTTAGYIHLEPEYLSSAADAVDAYFRELAPLVSRAISISLVPAKEHA